MAVRLPKLCRNPISAHTYPCQGGNPGTGSRPPPPRRDRKCHPRPQVRRRVEPSPPRPLRGQRHLDGGAGDRPQPGTLDDGGGNRPADLTLTYQQPNVPQTRDRPTCECHLLEPAPRRRVHITAATVHQRHLSAIHPSQSHPHVPHPPFRCRHRPVRWIRGKIAASKPQRSTNQVHYATIRTLHIPD